MIDDVLASLDAHVSKHIVKHCILDILKDRTRIIVTENRTLFFYSNQILHVERGVVSTSDFALCSFESEHLESESSTSSSELNTPINFELNSDDSPNPNNSVFQVNIDHFETQNRRKNVTNLFPQEIKETGSLSSHVLAVYWKALGASMGLLIVLSLIFMQVSRNFSDIWLAHWIESIKTTTITPLQPMERAFDLKSYTDNVKEGLMCLLKKYVAIFGNIECPRNVDTNSTVEDTQAAQNSYYLAIYIGIAVFNSIIALVRSFAFAYAGIKAAKFIHDRLLNSVIFVSLSLNRFSFENAENILMHLHLSD